VHHLDEAWSIMMKMQKYFFEVVVCRRAHVLFMLCVFAYHCGIQHVLNIRVA
jgi:hypothetical protein